MKWIRNFVLVLLVAMGILGFSCSTNNDLHLADDVTGPQSIELVEIN